jgi:predicted transcriptional regulator of viral defense system
MFRHREMARPTRLTIAKNDILSTLEMASQKVFSPSQMSELLIENREFWRLSQKTTALDFVHFLQKQGKLKEAIFESETYGRKITRYSWGEASVYEFAQSLAPKGYLSHATAIALHGLNDLLPTRLFVNVEQSAKPAAKNSLTQHGIDLAFSRDQRQSSMTYKFQHWSATIINGKHTNALGVEETRGPSNEKLRVTNLERTLIDIIVRPGYSGGIFQVLEAYRAAKERISTNRLLVTLKRLEYVYPYHQAIGFLMERAGYDQKRYDLLKQLGFSHDFYLLHGMKNPEYSSAWRIYYPKGV